MSQQFAAAQAFLNEERDLMVRRRTQPKKRAKRAPVPARPPRRRTVQLSPAVADIVARLKRVSALKKRLGLPAKLTATEINLGVLRAASAREIYYLVDRARRTDAGGRLVSRKTLEFQSKARVLGPAWVHDVLTQFERALYAPPSSRGLPQILSDVPDNLRPALLRVIAGYKTRYKTREGFDPQKTARLIEILARSSVPPAKRAPLLLSFLVEKAKQSPSPRR